MQAENDYALLMLCTDPILEKVVQKAAVMAAWGIWYRILKP